MNLTERLRQGLGVIWAVVPYCLLLTVGFADANESSLADEEALTDPQTEEANAIPMASAGDASDNDSGLPTVIRTVETYSETAVPVQDDQSTVESVPEMVVYDWFGHAYIKSTGDFYVGPPVPNVVVDAAKTGELSKLNIAENIDLSEPVAAIPDVNAIDVGQIAPPVPPPVTVYKQKSLLMLGAEVPAGTSTRLAWSPDQSFDGIAAPTPVLVVNGAKPGPVLCLTAAIHGDELNGIEVVRRVLYDLEPEELSGAVIGVPIVNLQGFRRSSRYLPDRRDLNRYFPGNQNGSAAARLAHSFFTEVIANCDALVDMHTGSFQRTNLPQLRANLKNPQIVELTQGFGSTVVLHGAGTKGTLRRAAADAGIPSVTVEAGEPSRIQEKDVSHSTKGIMTLLNELGMYDRTTNWGSREPVYYHSKWVRADSGGVLFSKVELGARVREGEVLGTVTDPITNVQSELRASANGRILGMALDQFVMPGFAAFRIGIETPENEVPSPTAIDVAANNALAEDFDGSPDSPAFADTEDESYDEYEDEAELLDVRDNFEDSE
jgi:predicted deacylase